MRTSVNPTKIEKEVASQYGSFFGSNLIRIGKENFDLKYNEKCKDGNFPFLPITAVPKYFIRKVFVESMNFAPDPITGNPMIVINDDPSIMIPANKRMEKSDPTTIGNLLVSNDPTTLDGIFFDNEESAAQVVQNFNKTTMRAIEDAISYLMEAQKGLADINKATLSGVGQ